MMKIARRTMLGAFALSAATLAGVPAASAQSTDGTPEVTLRLHQFQPSRATIASKVLKPWTEAVAKASGGRIAIEQFDAMALGGRPNELMDQATDGAVDIVMTVVGYSPGRFPRSEVFELPFMMSDVVGTSLAYDQMIRDDFAQNEFANLHVLAGFVHGPGALHTTEPVASLDDLKGLKLRGPTRIINAMLSKLGATAVGMPLPAIPEAISKGVIDGTVLPWEVTPAVKLSELVGHHTEFSGNEALYTATVVVAMNKAKYDAMPDDLRAILDAESGAKLSALAGRELAAMDAPGRAIAEKRGNAIVTLDADATAKWKAAAQPVIDGWVEEMKGREIDGAALIERARALIVEKSN